MIAETLSFSGSPTGSSPDEAAPDDLSPDDTASDGTRIVAKAAKQPDVKDNVIKELPSPVCGISARDIISSRKLKGSRGHEAAVMAIFPLCGEGDFVSVDRLGHALIWSGVKNEAYELITLPSDYSLVEFSPTGLYFAVLKEGVINIFPVGAPNSLYSLNRLGASVVSIDFAPDGQSLLIGAADSRVYRWRFIAEEKAESLREKEKVFERYVAHPAAVSSVRFHPQGRIFFSGDLTGGLDVSLLYDSDRFGGEYDENLFGPRLFAQKGNTRRNAPRQKGAGVSLLRVSPDGKLLVLSDEQGKLEVWQVRGFKPMASVQAHRGLILDFGISPDSRHIVTVGREGSMHVWELQKDELGVSSLKSIDERGEISPSKVGFVDATHVVLGKLDGGIERIEIAATQGTEK